MLTTVIDMAVSIEDGLFGAIQDCHDTRFINDRGATHWLSYAKQLNSPVSLFRTFLHPSTGLR